MFYELLFEIDCLKTKSIKEALEEIDKVKLVRFKTVGIKNPMNIVYVVRKNFCRMMLLVALR